MSYRLFALSPDLKQLRDEGYDVEVRSGYLLLKDVPYVNADKNVKRGVLGTQLNLAGDTTSTPGTHVAYFSGSHPCHRDGTVIAQIQHESAMMKIDDDLTFDHSFSSMPPSGSYPDYYELMVAYVAIISNPAHSLDPNATAKTFPVIEVEDEDSVFAYQDTASSRAGISAASARLKTGPIGIIGLGGTGAYVLDLIAKTPVREIHLFDGDVFSQHNAFRSPGAVSVEELRAKPKKVEYLRSHYSRMHRHIVAHPYHLDASNVSELDGIEFVFLCMDSGPTKNIAVEHLEALGTSFIDVGMGLTLVDDTLLGMLRMTASTADHRDHVRARNRIPMCGGDPDEYSQNIQIADLNALNAALAVVKWKKLRGFYLDRERKDFCAYLIDGNDIINEDPI